MLLLSPKQWSDYELIDCGGFEKLERFGKYVLRRPEPKAVWAKTLSEKEWKSMPHTIFSTGAGFGRSGKEDSGQWLNKNMPDQWYIQYAYKNLKIKMRLGLTAFKHVGVFPEQAPNWNYLYDTIQALKNNKPPKILNLFAYTGGASLAAKSAGADITHLDSVKQVVTWARENMAASNLDNIRWIIDDALKFVRREVKRGNQYQGIILDPPAYGHGIDGEKWKLDEDILEMMTECSKILAPNNSFLLLNLYSNGFSALVADTLTNTIFPNKKQNEFGELVLEDNFGKKLPLSVFSRFSL